MIFFRSPWYKNSPLHIPHTNTNTNLHAHPFPESAQPPILWHPNMYTSHTHCPKTHSIEHYLPQKQQCLLFPCPFPFLLCESPNPLLTSRWLRGGIKCTCLWVGEGGGLVRGGSGWGAGHWHVAFSTEEVEGVSPRVWEPFLFSPNICLLAVS